MLTHRTHTSWSSCKEAKRNGCNYPIVLCRSQKHQKELLDLVKMQSENSHKVTMAALTVGKNKEEEPEKKAEPGKGAQGGKEEASEEDDHDSAEMQRKIEILVQTRKKPAVAKYALKALKDLTRESAHEDLQAQYDALKDLDDSEDKEVLEMMKAEVRSTCENNRATKRQKTA
jgi:hypothetical protein